MLTLTIDKQSEVKSREKSFSGTANRTTLVFDLQLCTCVI